MEQTWMEYAALDMAYTALKCDALDNTASEYNELILHCNEVSCIEIYSTNTLHWFTLYYHTLYWITLHLN